MTICIGRQIIETLASEGAWKSENGDAVVAASELFGSSPYAEIERLRAALRPFAVAGQEAGDIQSHGGAELYAINRVGLMDFLIARDTFYRADEQSPRQNEKA